MLESALENKNVTLGMYKAGKSNMLDVLEAEASYADAEKEKITSEYQKVVAEALLLKSLGQLNQQTISEEKRGDTNAINTIDDKIIY
jgi:outer membrane protein TolC